MGRKQINRDDAWVEKMVKRILQDGGPNLSQSDYAALIHVHRSVVCCLSKAGILPGKGKWRTWWTPHHAYLRGIAGWLRGRGV